MSEISTLQYLAGALGIRQKIQNKPLRIMYFRNVWGLEQKSIAELEKMAQSSVSNFLKENHISMQDVLNSVVIDFTIEEIKYLHKLPRAVLYDSQLVAFVNNILGENIIHPFYATPQFTDNIRVAALADLGIRPKLLMEIFNKTQPAVSVIKKRSVEKAKTIQNELRYDVESSVFMIEPKPPRNSIKFQLAGGITNEVY